MSDAVAVEEQAQALMEKNDGLLTDEQVVNLLDGNTETGDTAGDEPTPDPAGDDDKVKESPDETTDNAPDPEQAGAEGDDSGDEQDNDDEPVILAKDGKHTIEYQKLVDAREAKQAAEATAAELQQKYDDLAEQLEKLQELGNTDLENGDDADDLQDQIDSLAEELDELGEDYPAVAKIISTLKKSNSELMTKVEQLNSELKDSTKLTEAEKHFKQIHDAHSDIDSILESKEFEDWFTGQPSIIKNAYAQVLQQGTAPQVIELMDTYKNATAGDKADGDPTKSDKTKAVDVDKAIDKAKEKGAAPGSLSDVPGSTAHHDEGAAILEMSPNAALGKLEGKTPEQINALLEKVL